MNNSKDPPIPKKIIIRKNTGIAELNLNVFNKRPSNHTIPNNIKSKSKKIPKDVSSSDEDSADDDASDRQQFADLHDGYSADVAAVAGGRADRLA